MTTLEKLQGKIVRCTRCPRLVEHREKMAVVKRRAYKSEAYWGKPIPSFGDPLARLWILGLAPAAHGANRTGRMFTGDRSGEWLYRVLYETGFASQPNSVSKDDGLELTDAFISAAVHCAPPDNKPSPEEIRECAGYLQEEWKELPRVRVLLALGSIAFRAAVGLLQAQTPQKLPKLEFGHHRIYTVGDKVLIASYHPSQQNTQTGRLTWKMWKDVFENARGRLTN